MTTTLIPLPEGAYGRSNLLLSLKEVITVPCSEFGKYWPLVNTVYSLLEASFCSKTACARPRFRIRNVAFVSAIVFRETADFISVIVAFRRLAGVVGNGKERRATERKREYL